MSRTKHLERGYYGWPNNISRIGSNTILEFKLQLTQPQKLVLEARITRQRQKLNPSLFA
jgi:hypothetical protein